MKKTLCALVLASSALIPSGDVSAQNPILLDAYGRGVHAFYSGNNTEAYESLSAAVSGGLQDPRAYYFLGLVSANRGSQFEAESYWRQGAQLEAEGKIVGSIGRALTRFQGHQRLKLEEIRRQAKLNYLAVSAAKSRQRFGEIRAAESEVLRDSASSAPPMAPPAPPAAGAAADPFAGQADAKPSVEKSDSFENAMENPFADDPAPGAAPGAAAPGGAPDPFNTPPAGGNAPDPFNTGGDAPANNPFDAGGGNPFDASSDPFK